VRIAALATGVGNLRSVVRALERAVQGSKEVFVTADPDVVRRSDVLVVPGQGSFGAFAAAIDGHGLREALLERIQAGTPYLGICLGLQILFESSDEAPGARGLGVLRGHVRKLDPGTEEGANGSSLLPLPHIGWNWVTPSEREPHRLRGILEADHYYFAHSYAAMPDDPAVVLGATDYGAARIVSAASASEVVMGVQFHPEKSQRAGLGLLERFFRALR
jgi:imidazole glycerol-phosphate synthase subunit HisH